MRTVWLLAVAQAFSAAGMMTMFLLGGILGSELAPSPQLATLPLSLLIVGLALATVPAALAMQRYGRRRAFIASATLAATAALTVAWAIVIESFALLCAASVALGVNLAFQQQQRFAAAESVPAERASQAISTFMVGTLAAAVIGPQLALACKHLLPRHEYAGSFLVVAALCVASAAVLTRYRPTPVQSSASGGEARPLRVVAAQPDFLVAVAASVVAFSVMSFIMTATPISMHVHDHHSDMRTAWVIQSHVLAMYGPSLVSGRLIGRIGARAGMLAGLALMVACVIVDGSGRALTHYWWGLVLLGLGWNLLFVAGTTLLTASYRPAERYRAQAVNEFAVFGAQALASLLAGPALHALGWTKLNLATLPLIAALVLVLLLRAARPFAAPAATGRAPVSDRETR
jgi:MFS family permease